MRSIQEIFNLLIKGAGTAHYRQGGFMCNEVGRAVRQSLEVNGHPPAISEEEADMALAGIFDLINYVQRTYVSAEAESFEPDDTIALSSMFSQGIIGRLGLTDERHSAIDFVDFRHIEQANCEIYSNWDQRYVLADKLVLAQAIQVKAKIMDLSPRAGRALQEIVAAIDLEAA